MSSGSLECIYPNPFLFTKFSSSSSEPSQLFTLADRQHSHFCLSFLLPDQGLLWAGMDSFGHFLFPALQTATVDMQGCICGCTFPFLGYSLSDGQLDHMDCLLTSVKLLTPSVPWLTNVSGQSLRWLFCWTLSCPPSVC